MPTNNTENVYTHEYEDTGAPIPGTKIGYDNTESGLEATNMQAAIDELESKIKASDEASEITYDNDESGLTAENVQAAIDEINNKIPSNYELVGKYTVSGTSADGGINGACAAALTNLNTAVAALSDDEMIEIVSVRVPTITPYLNVKPTTGFFKNNNTVVEVEAGAVAVSSTGLVLTAILVGSTNMCSNAAIASADNSVTCRGLMTTSGSATVEIVYRKYSK